MEFCLECGGPLARRVDVVKDGVVYQASACALDHTKLTESPMAGLPVHWGSEQGLRVAQLAPGRKMYVFDRRYLRKAFRDIVHRCRFSPADLALDLSSFSLMGEALGSLLKSLDNGLRSRGHSLWIVTSSSLLAKDVRAAAPSLTGRIVAKLQDVAGAAKVALEGQKPALA